MIPLRFAVCCADLACQAVWDVRQRKTCPACSFSLFLNLSRVLNRRTELSHAQRD